MRLRLFACVALAMMVAGASALSSRRALAQDERSGRGERSDPKREGSEAHPADIDKALKAYDERMDRDLEKCRHEMDQMKKELHELIDLRLGMAMSMAELRARHSMHGGTGGSVAASREGGGQGHSDDHASLARELQPIHNQLRSELEQQRNQVDQLAAQLREMKRQAQQASHAEDSARDRQRPQSGQGQPGQGQQSGNPGRDKG